MRALWRILIVIPFAFIVASIAASFLLVLSASTGVEPLPGDTGGDFTAKLLFLVLIGSFFVGAVAGVPSLVMIVLAEAFGWRSLILHLLIGAGMGFAAYLTGIGNPEPSQAVLTAFGAAGAVAGFVYWAIAGREAGLARREPHQVSPKAR